MLEKSVILMNLMVLDNRVRWHGLVVAGPMLHLG